jgi:hypothetical protein
MINNEKRRIPRNQRVVIKPAQFVTRPWQTVTRPKRNMHMDTITNQQDATYARNSGAYTKDEASIS